MSGFQSTEQALDGFFSTLSGALTSAVGQSARLVPIWAAQQLELQSQDQLARFGTTFTPQGLVNPLPQPRAQPTAISGSISTGTAVAIVGVAGVLLLIGLRS